MAKPAPADPFAKRGPVTPEPEDVFDPAKEQHTGIVMGIAMASYRTPKGEDRFLVLPGDDVKLTFPTAGQPPKAVSDNFTVVDFYESKMAEYDSIFVFMPIRKLQELRGMIDPSTNVGLVNSIQIKVKPGVDGNEVRDKLRAAFAPELYVVSTWRDKQGALLAAVQMETAILNILLFLIIAVAGFGILAIFYMIVVEKTRDIGILKSLGASGRGVMGIFLSYGLSLGLVGSGVGMIVGLLFVRYINQIADGLGWITGHPVFNPEIYYFYKIPTIVFPTTVAWIVLGAMAIAVLASILPARRAARLHPVEALRYE
jgi:lipoprotein-releasing system permease protein